MKVVSKTRVEGDYGLSVQLDRGVVKYSIEGRHINIEVEHGIGDISIYKESIQKWFPPYEKETIDDARRNKIVSDICDAMSLIGVKYVVE